MNGQRSTHPGAVLRNATLVLPETLSSETLCLAGGRVAAFPQAGAWEGDLREHLIFPGLVNAHDHLHLNAYPSLRQLGVEARFPNSYAWMEAFQAHLSDPEARKARAIPEPLRHWHGALKNLLCGATAVAHHDPWHPVFDDPNFPVRVARHCGWSHSLGLGLPDASRSPLCYGPRVTESFAATPASRPWIIHLAEGTDEIAASELNLLDELGCLAANTALVHGVGLTETDIMTLIARGAGVVWCPGSNLAMLGKTLDPRRLMEAGRLALGSDSRLSGSQDMLAELRLAARQSDCAACELLRLVTEAGSRLLRMPEVGGLKCGQWADFVITRADGYDPYTSLLAVRRAELRAVVRNGTPAMADPDFADWFAACGVATTRVLLDGRPKLIATALLGPPGAAELEPGLEILEARDA